MQNFPHAYRWYKHIASHQADFSQLPGDPSKSYTTYGPESAALTTNPKDAPNDDDEAADEAALFGSDDAEADAEAVKQREANLAAYKKKKEGKTKPAAKSIVTLDVKPWGEISLLSLFPTPLQNESKPVCLSRHKDRCRAPMKQEKQMAKAKYNSQQGTILFFLFPFFLFFSFFKIH